jgi:hypothetical protein
MVGFNQTYTAILEGCIRADLMKGGPRRIAGFQSRVGIRSKIYEIRRRI